MGKARNENIHKWGFSGRRAPLMGSRGNTPGRGQRVKSPEAEGNFKVKKYLTLTCAS